MNPPPPSPFHQEEFYIYPQPNIMGAHHLLFDAQKREAVLIDTGFFADMGGVRRTMTALGLAWTDIKAILLTHGHLDHTGNLVKIKELTGAPLYAHPLEQPHIDGTFPYTGVARGCGILEAMGRSILRYKPASLEVPISDGLELPFWGGLRVVHLPGHTQGHCGFYSARLNLIFSGDLFASYWFKTATSPPFLNTCPELFPESFRKLGRLNPQYVIPNHYSKMDPALNRKALTWLMARMKL